MPKMLNNDFFALRKPQAQPRQGDILLSEPFLMEHFFNRAAISLVDYDANKTVMGLVLNHKTKYLLNDVIEGIEVDAKIPLYCGGPLSSDRLFYIHTLGSKIPDSSEVVPGLYANGDLRVIKSYINSGAPLDGVIRFFIGYSGWDRGQLDDELNNHVWGVLQTEGMKYSKFLRGNGETFWQKCVKMKGAEYRPWLLCPSYPGLN